MDNRRNIIIVVVVIILLCCCCSIAAVGGYWLWQNGDRLVGTSQIHSLLPLLPVLLTA